MDAAQARQAAIEWLARREHSCAELIAKLERNGCAPEMAQRVTEHLIEQGLLSDERFADALLHSRRRRGYGPVRIRKELEERGLSQEAAAQCVDARSDDWLVELERVRRRKFGEGVPRSFEERATQIRFLQYRGFTYEQIQRALNSQAAG